MKKVLLMLAILLWVSCGETDDSTRPATFGDHCAATPSWCVKPYSCLDTGNNQLRCTRTCKSTAECPEFFEAGKDWQSECLPNVNVCSPITRR